MAQKLGRGFAYSHFPVPLHSMAHREHRHRLISCVPEVIYAVLAEEVKVVGTDCHCETVSHPVLGHFLFYEIMIA